MDMKPTQEQVIAWAREAGGWKQWEARVMTPQVLEHFAALAYEAGRKDKSAGEVRKQTVRSECPATPKEWEIDAERRAIEEWNKRAVLAQPKQEKLGEIVPADEEQLERIAKLVKPEPQGGYRWREGDVPPSMTYTAPPQREYTAWNIKYNREPLPSDNPHEVVAVAKREWQGLTDEDMRKLSDDCAGVRDENEFIRAIEAKLKEKNT